MGGCFLLTNSCPRAAPLVVVDGALADIWNPVDRGVAVR